MVSKPFAFKWIVLIVNSDKAILLTIRNIFIASLIKLSRRILQKDPNINKFIFLFVKASRFATFGFYLMFRAAYQSPTKKVSVIFL